MDTCHDAVLAPTADLQAAMCTTRSMHCTETLLSLPMVLDGHGVARTPELGASPAQLPHRLAAYSIHLVAVAHQEAYGHYYCCCRCCFLQCV